MCGLSKRFTIRRERVNRLNWKRYRRRNGPPAANKSNVRPCLSQSSSMRNRPAEVNLMEPASYWKLPGTPTRYPSLESNLEVDAVIIGGGLTGITTAYLL